MEERNLRRRFNVEAKSIALRFKDPRPEEFSKAGINPHLLHYWSHGEPVLVGAEADRLRQDWSAVFGRAAPLHLEIGCGNGFYLSGMAARREEENWLGIELRYKRVMMCAKKIMAAGVQNARILRYDAFCVDELFGEDELSGLHTNHPDPWGKERHRKKRLLNTEFAAWACRALRIGSTWRIKTDHRPHIEEVLKVIEDLRLEVSGMSEDTSAEGPPWPASDDVITNYQRKRSQLGLPIYSLELRRY
jgi:tRNA (guanine-N7-)-methyltransferase